MAAAGEEFDHIRDQSDHSDEEDETFPVDEYADYGEFLEVPFDDREIDIVSALKRSFTRRGKYFEGSETAFSLSRLIKGEPNISRLYNDYPARFIFLVLNSKRDFPYELVENALERIEMPQKIELLKVVMNLDPLNPDMDQEDREILSDETYNEISRNIRGLSLSGFFAFILLFDETYDEGVHGPMIDNIFNSIFVAILINLRMKGDFFLLNLFVDILLKHDENPLLILNALSSDSTFLRGSRIPADLLMELISKLLDKMIASDRPFRLHLGDETPAKGILRIPLNIFQLAIEKFFASGKADEAFIIRFLRYLEQAKQFDRILNDRRAFHGPGHSVEKFVFFCRFPGVRERAAALIVNPELRTAIGL